MKSFYPAIVVALAMQSSVFAAPLVYTPINPSFGGNPLNSSHLMGLAGAQRTATAPAEDDDDDGPDGPGSTPGSSDADLFIRQLQGRLLSALASQVTEAIFGENPQDNGTIVFGDTKVEFENALNYIRLTITGPDGETEIVVPRLVVQ